MKSSAQDLLCNADLHPERPLTKPGGRAGVSKPKPLMQKGFILKLNNVR